MLGFKNYILFIYCVSVCVCGGIHAIIVCMCVCEGWYTCCHLTRGGQRTILQEVGCLLLLGVVVSAFTL